VSDVFREVIKLSSEVSECKPLGMGAAAAAGRRALGFGCNGRVAAAVGSRRAFRCSAANARMTEETNDALEDMAEQNAKSQRLAQQASDNTTSRHPIHNLFHDSVPRATAAASHPHFRYVSSLHLRPFRCNAGDMAESLCVGTPAPSIRWPNGSPRRLYLRRIPCPVRLCARSLNSLYHMTRH
jgi:hypothetical protein